MSCKVFLVGAGPGDPGLITVKGLECIRNADVIIYDYLASPRLLGNAGKDAEIIYVGKKGGEHTLSQEKINDLIVDKAKSGLTVARLKGGDPFIFGRGAEEAEVLIKAGIPFEIVPGVTSAIAAPAYAGIPLTHRKYTSTLAFVTGHEDPSKEESRINWASLSKGIGTIVFLMGVKNLPNIASQLINHGMESDTPVALIRWGTTPNQFTVTGTLDNIVQRVESAGLKSPAIIVVGNVVKVRKSMKWFETRPLIGKKIIITRSREQASDMVKILSDLGADCMECPTIKVEPPDDLRPLDSAIENITDYDWLVFTSVNGVDFFFDRFFQNQDRDMRSFPSIHTAVIGPATQKRLLKFGLRSDIIPKSYLAESVVEAFADKDIKGKRILLPRAEEARPLLPVELRKMGAFVDEVTAYCTKQDLSSTDTMINELREGKVDLVTFTSSSTVKNFYALLPEKDISRLLDGLTTASIGPITADTAKNLGINVDIIAKSFTIPGLCKAILKHYKSE